MRPFLICSILVISACSIQSKKKLEEKRSLASLPDSMVYLRDIDASIQQDIKYAGAWNFTGQPVPGYLAAECVLLKDVAKALSRVQQSLPKHLSLKVYDCYRPDHAVKSFVKWVKDVDAYDYAEQFYPRLKKKDLIKKGYIADRSSHSKGYVVDLTIVKKSRPMPELDELADYGDCTGQERLADNSIDMGTSFDCFDHLAHTSNRKISARARANRQLLVEAMKKEGFRNYKKEWWHFWYRGKKYKKVYDFPILPNN